MANKRKCRYCGTRRDKSTMFIRGILAFCDTDHAAKFGIENKERGKKIQKKEKQAKTKEFLENDYSYQFGLTKTRCQRLGNLLDLHLPCICCDTPRGKSQWSGGHFKTSGGHPELALDLRNIFGQRNYLCNMNKSGNIDGDKHSHGFREGIRRRYGQALLDYLDGPHPAKQRSAQELKAYRKEINAEIKRLESGLPPSKDWRALPKIIAE